VKQSIYRFRGGKKELFYAVTDAYDIKVDQLVTNYRSEKEVVEFVNDVFINKIKGYVPQKVKEEATKGYVEVIFNEEVLESMMKILKELIAQGADINEIAILTATNANGASVEEMLKAENIDVVTETTSKLINQKNVRALIEYLKYSYFNKPIYARNFFALIEQTPTKLYPCDVHAKDLSGELKKVIIKYRLYDGDMNIFSFLDKLSHYSDIEAFLYEYERLDSAAAQKELKGVRVLTVHKSKGLEYEHVIVLDRLGKASADKSPIIYEYEGVHLQNIYLRMKNRAGLDEAYSKAIDKEKELSKEDELNALYVAFTRAKESLFIIHKHKDSKFEALELSEGARGVLELQVKPPVPKEVKPELEYQELYYGTQSDLLALAKEESEDHKAIQFGLALHYTLEMMAEFDAKSLESALSTAKNRFAAVLSGEEFSSIEKRIHTLVSDDTFQSLVEGKVYKEKAISFQDELRYIDLLVHNKEEWVVVDYKSSMTYTESHLKQVSFYKKAIGQITAEKVQGYICYLLEEGIKLVEV
jgi:exodeoxyribonuclease V beta subunit